MFASPSDIVNQGMRGPRRARSDRRTLNRLRELCDEVLASYRVARGRDIVSPDDRRAAEKLLADVTPKVPHHRKSAARK